MCPMNLSEYNTSLFDFLSSSPTPFHATHNIANFLRENNFRRLKENERWHLQQGESYYLTREDSAVISFTLGVSETPEEGFRMIAAHTDSPCLQIKPQPDLNQSSYHQLGVEVYGGSLLAPWFDRALSLAGRICCKTANEVLRILLIDFKRPLLTIPSLAIHLDRDANSGKDINKQNHLPPILAQSVDEQLGPFNTHLLQQAKQQYPEIDIDKILSFDIFCYENQGPLFTGINNELISSPRLDNLLSCHAAMTAMVLADKTKNSFLFCANHEENGSLSSTGAQSSFVNTVIKRIMTNSESRSIALSNSFLISADNAHATHPNFMDRMDKQHEIHLNRGPVIKINANQRYATSSTSSSIFKHLCSKINIPTQDFVMRSDMACGSTIGPMTAAGLGVRTIDIGAPTLGMHSIREITGTRDPEFIFNSLLYFLNNNIHKNVS